MTRDNDNIEQIDRFLKEFMIKFSENNYKKQDHERFLELLETLPHEERNRYMEEFFFQQQKTKLQSKDRQQLIDSIEAAINSTSEAAAPVRKPGFPLYKLSIAAAIVVILSGTAIIFKNRFSTSRNDSASAELRRIPGPANTADQISLTLANGSVILLDSVSTGLLATESGSKITKSDNGVIVYDISGSLPEKETGFNTLQTPRGKQYQIILPDKSKVWLNAASSIKFPTQFVGERRVELEGEAYFEISKDKSKPFRVVSRGQTTEVLGTVFNINSYQDQKEVRTTLVEGSIKVSASSSGQQRVLRPGQQSAVQDEIKVYAIDPQEVIAWKTGHLVFEHQNIRNIMQQIERWYDVQVAYNGNITNESFLGSVKRYDDVKDVLNTLELTGLVHFKIEGKNITVLP